MPNERLLSSHESTRATLPCEDGSPNSPTSPSFEESLAELQRIVNELEQGDLGLTDSLSRYEEGIRRLKVCYQQLESAERRMELLRRMDEDGRLVTEPFDDAQMTLEEKASARGARRSRARGEA